MKTITYEDRIKLVEEYQKWSINYVINTFFADPPSVPNSKIHNSATSTFLSTGLKEIVVTNNHVIEKYESLKMNYPKLNFHLGNLLLNDIDSRIIDRSEFYDLVTFEVSRKEIDFLEKQYCPSFSWPPREVEKNELLVFIGYPGIWREIQSLRKVKFDSAIFIEEIKSSCPESFKIHLDYSNYSILLGNRKFEELNDYGGFSGGGVFRINDKKLIASLELVGIIYEGNKNWEIQIASHANVINGDGTIKST